MWSVPELTTGKFGNYDAGMDQFFFSVVFHSYIILLVARQSVG